MRSLAYRYVDFATAVGSEEILGWYEGMLGVDGVHPIAKGAEALYHQLLKDVPEIMEKKENDYEECKSAFFECGR